jgi:hypothetical protein
MRHRNTFKVTIIIRTSIYIYSAALSTYLWTMVLKGFGVVCVLEDYVTELKETLDLVCERILSYGLGLSLSLGLSLGSH